MKLHKTEFNKCEMRETDFGNADLTNSIFSECDLSKTLFENTNLSKCDFRTSFNYSIDPDKNKIAKAKFSAQNVSGLLDKYNIVIE